MKKRLIEVLVRVSGARAACLKLYIVCNNLLITLLYAFLNKLVATSYKVMLHVNNIL